MKQRIKIGIDMGMTVLFLLEMAYHVTGNTLHEWLGMLLFVLFFVHHLLNLGWHRGLTKGKYSPIRLLVTVVDILLFTAMVGMMVSGILLSREVLGFLHLRAGMFGRRLHMVSTAWGYILMAAHLGLHWGRVVSITKKRLGGRFPGWLPRTAAVLFSLYGLYAFYSRGLWQHLFLMVEYAFFDYEELPVFFFADYVAILIAFATIFYYGMNALKPPQKEVLH